MIPLHRNPPSLLSIILVILFIYSPVFPSAIPKTPATNVNDISSSTQIAHRLSTKSRYKIPELDINDFPYPNCQLRQVQLISRHGTRNPTVPSIRGFQKISEALRNLTPSVFASFEGLDDITNHGLNTNFSFLKSWQNPFMEEEEGRLVLQGRMDMEDLAKRAYLRYGDVLNPYLVDQPSSGKWIVTTTKIERTMESAKAFLKGLYDAAATPATSDSNTMNMLDVGWKEIDNDPELRPFDYCPKFYCSLNASAPRCDEARQKYSLPSNDDDDTGVEYRRFTKVQFQKIADRLNDLLFKNESSSSFTQTADLPFVFSSDLVKGALELCAYQVAINNSVAEWCSIFTQKEIDSFHYSGDIQLYWTYGYSGSVDPKDAADTSKVNLWLACPLLGNITDTILSIGRPEYTWRHDRSHRRMFRHHRHKKLAESDLVQVHLRFAHAETLTPLLVTMGLYRDSTPLRANLSEEEILNRKFRTGDIMSFASNIWIELYECPASPSSSPKRTKRFPSPNTNNVPISDTTTSSSEDIPELSKPKLPSTSIYKIRLLLGEEPLSIPTKICQDGNVGVCSLEEWLEAFGERGQCDFDSICGRKVEKAGDAGAGGFDGVKQWSWLVNSYVEEKLRKLKN